MHRDSEHAQGLLISSRHLNISPLVLSIFMSFLRGSQSNMVTDYYFLGIPPLKQKSDRKMDTVTKEIIRT